MLLTALHAVVWFKAVGLGVPVVLAACTLNYVSFLQIIWKFLKVGKLLHYYHLISCVGLKIQPIGIVTPSVKVTPYEEYRLLGCVTVWFL
jgi:hypothetical protein